MRCLAGLPDVDGNCVLLNFAGRAASVGDVSLEQRRQSCHNGAMPVLYVLRFADIRLQIVGALGLANTHYSSNFQLILAQHYLMQLPELWKICVRTLLSSVLRFYTISSFGMGIMNFPPLCL